MAKAQIGKNVLGIGIAVILAVGGGMFFAGMKYGEGKSSDSTPGPGQFAGRGGGGGGGGAGGRANGGGGAGGANGGGGFATGSIISKDDQSITIKLQDGGSRIIYYSGSTSVGKMATGTAADLKSGDTVIANGSSNPDGSIAAQNIQVRPEGAPGFGGGGGGQVGGQGGPAPNGG